MSGSLGPLWSTFKEDFPYGLDLPQPARALGEPPPSRVTPEGAPTASHPRFDWPVGNIPWHVTAWVVA